MFEELFYKDPYQKEFDTEVVRCLQHNNVYEVVLKQTAFYPEGGGQPADHGTLNDAHVIDVKRRNDEIIHTVDCPLEEGSLVHGTIDWQRRFDHMQNHSGEHIFSGLIQQLYGYENIGFHLGEEEILIDFDGVLTEEDIQKVEDAANHIVDENAPLEETFPSEEALEHMEFRCKKELEGDVRIVIIPGADICACCGTHVKRTGEIGLIKAIAHEKHKDGTRIHLLCGNRARKDYTMKSKINTELYQMFSVRPWEVLDAVKKLNADSIQKNKTIHQVTEAYLGLRVESLNEEPCIIETVHGLSAQVMKDYANLIRDKKHPDTVVVLNEQEGKYLYLMLSETINLKEIAKDMNVELHGKGGGSSTMIQGTFEKPLDEILSTLKKYL